ncbi:hypothetical protein KSP39_PZI023390 [Platanthera zijinensis]|uniref:Uncharacterized protein n=1 Tax=Platanthera zijinensis TaxID=2320716 RepID=A0AAP0ATE9_9ASPA
MLDLARVLHGHSTGFTQVLFLRAVRATSQSHRTEPPLNPFRKPLRSHSPPIVALFAIPLRLGQKTWSEAAGEIPNEKRATVQDHQLK